MRVNWLLSLCALALPLSAQIQFPGSGGPFPGGGRNGGPNSGGSNPGGQGGNSPGRNAPVRGLPGRNRKEAPPVITTTGILRVVAGNQFVLEADDHRIITYRLGAKPEILKDAKPAELTSFAVADHLSVDTFADESGYFTATAVTFNSAGTAQEQAEAARTWDLPKLASVAKAPAGGGSREADGERPTLRRSTPDAEPKAADASVRDDTPQDNRPTTTVRPADPTPDADDPGRPQLRRGKPATRLSARSAPPESDVTPAATPMAPAPSAAPRTQASAPSSIIPIGEDPVLVKAREAAAAYSGMLPNFFCRQVTTRYESDTPKDGWQARDTITADLTYENGAESYKNIRVGNQAPKDSMEDVGGNWSTGEFASLAEELFDPGTATTFRRIGADTIQGRSAYSFKFEVAREHSRWRVSVGGQLYYPAYRGTIWVDRETSRVLRLESESRNVPALFPLSKVEQAVDYDFVRLSTAQPFLLPTKAEVLSCEQAGNRCVRNRIEFRNYRKFGAESEITFGEKQ
jgi:hypothetical protein